MDGGQVLLLWIRKPDSDFDEEDFSDDLDDGEDMDGPEDGLN